MDKRPHQDGGADLSYPKRPRIAHSLPNGGAHGHQEAASPPPGHMHSDYTIAWICALPLELAASRAMLDEEHRLLPLLPGDENMYVLGRIDRHNVVMACLPGHYGTNNAAIVATDLKRSFPGIRATLMVGIGGGAPAMADLHLGDVVVGTRVMQYDMGRDVGDGRFEVTADAKIPARLLLSAVTTVRATHERDGSSRRVTSLLRTRLSSYSRPNEPDRLFQASYDHPSGTPTCDGCDPVKLQPRRVHVADEPKIHYGGIASGNSVMRNASKRDNIAQRFSVLCFEMEAAGMMDWQCLPIRGICDYADSHKNKHWQGYAAATAAAYARQLLETLSVARAESGRAASWLTSASQPEAVGMLPSPSLLFMLTRRDHGQFPERRQRLLESLDFPQIDARKTTIQAAHAKTCRWFLQHPKYKDWLDPGKQSQNLGFLWMRGKAGAGKSTIMKFIYLETKKRSKNDSTAVASFFFNARGEDLEKSVAGMYRYLLVQLLRSFPDLQSVLDDTDIVPRGQQDCPNMNALKELLKSAVTALGQRSFTSFIDALDECDEQEVRDMVEFFEDLADTTTEGGIQFRVCFSSRPYPYIDMHRGALLVLEDESGHGDDLAEYVKTRLKINSRSLLAELQSQILDKAAGIFMWIVLVVDILNEESRQGALALRTKLAGIPPKLSDLFRSILARDEKEPERLLICILWVLCAKRPLSPGEFRHAVWAGLLDQRLSDPDLPDNTDQDAVALVTSSSKGLVEVTKAKQPTVQFIHESVRDFLVKENGLRELWPDLGFEWEGHSHERLKRCCVTYLSLPEVRAIFNGASDAGERGAPAERYLFLDYASQQVLPHANEAAAIIPQDEFLSQFFASDGVRVVNLFERFKSRRYGCDATPIYIFADKGLERLARTQSKRELASYIPGETYGYPFFAALAGGHKGTAAALLDLPSKTCDGVDIFEGLKHRKDLERYKGRTPLSWAAQEGRLSIVTAMLEQGTDISERDRKGYTPFARALENGHGDLAQLLIDNGADVNAQSINGWTALVGASLKGHEAVARLLINNSADINARHSDRSTALIWASKNGHEAVARLLIEKGADVDAQDNNRWTALIWASKNEHEAVARLLIEKGADVHAQNNDGWTALIRASAIGHEAAARLLIEKGADVDARDNDGWTALIWAIRWGHETVARLLIEKGADVDARDNDGWTALIQASEIGHEAVARLLIEKGADVDARDNDGWTALIRASVNGHETVARLLIDKGADVNAQSINGWTALLGASRKGHEAAARVLADNGADINVRHSDGSTALIQASEIGHEAVARLLIDKGADVNARDNNRSTALIWASENRHEAVARLLIDKGADVNARDNDGSTALIWASIIGHGAVARLLVDNGADINARNKNGWTALTHMRL